MRYNQLGNTGLFVSELCLGTMTFGGAGQNGIWGGVASLGQDGVDQVVGRSIAAGINFFDTADVYSIGQSEELLGQSITNLGVKREDVILATKVHGAMGEGPNQRGSSRGHIMDSVGGSLKRLRTDHIDLYQLHGTDTVTPIDETLRALDDLVTSGKVRYVGVSNWQAWRIAKALGISERKGYARFETIQSYYSIAGRDLEREIVPLINEEKLGLMVWSPMAGGLLSGKYGPGAPGNGEGRRANFNFPPVNED
ncbi:MAG: aldo/keto reductase, partial [Mesorhizobium sp.]|nr:aldo/keto reductase [Mesorhizobium sp.]